MLFLNFSKSNIWNKCQWEKWFSKGHS